MSSASRYAKPLQQKKCIQWLFLTGIFIAAMPFACSDTPHVLGAPVSLRSLSYCLQLLLIPHGSSCVLHSPSLNHSFITFHFTSFADPSLLQRLVPNDTQNLNTDRVTCTSANHHTPLTGLHFTSFRRVSFSTVQSTRCHTFLLAGRPFRLRSLCAANCFVRTSHSQSCTSVHLHTSAASVP